MSNYCRTNYAITGNPEQVKDLFAKMKKIEESPDLPQYRCMSHMNIPNLLVSLGCENEIEDIDLMRSSWSDLTLNVEKNVLFFNTESPWNRCLELEGQIEESYPDLMIYYVAEEIMTDIFETNDVDREYLPKQYAICDPWEMPLYTEKEFFERMNELAGDQGPFETFEQVEEWCEKHNQEDEENGDGDNWINVYKAEDGCGGYY